MSMSDFQPYPFSIQFKNSKSMFDETTDASLNFRDSDFNSNTPWYFKEARMYPGKTCHWYFTENGYQYCKRATWNEQTKTMKTNWKCPVSEHHHIGNTCYVCGLKN